MDYIKILSEKIQVVHVANSLGLGELDKEGLTMKDGEADCKKVIIELLNNRLIPLVLVSEPSPYPYGLDYIALGNIMKDEQTEIFKICSKLYN